MWTKLSDIHNLEHCFPGHGRKEKKITLFGPDLNPELPGVTIDYLPLDH